MAKKWVDIKQTSLTDEQQERVERRVQEELLSMTLQELRGARKLTQAQLAELLAVSQPQLSRLERSQNPMLATLRKLVEAMGGELKIVAEFPDEKIELSV